MKIRSVLFLVLMHGTVAAPNSDRLSDFRPSGIRTDYGSVSEVEFSTRLVELEAGALAYHLPQAMKDFRFAEPVWVIGYKTQIFDAHGKHPHQNYLCHTFFGDQRVDQQQDNELKGIYSDAFTPEVRLPEGFGIKLSADEVLHWMPMFNNRADEPVRVSMKVVVTVIRAKDLKRALTPVYASLRSVQTPHLFFVAPGRDERQITFELPFDAKIHFLGTHLHPHGASIELYNISRHEQVWKGARKRDGSDAMEVYSNTAGYQVRAGETYKLLSVYENPTAQVIDAMAGLFMLYSR